SVDPAARPPICLPELVSPGLDCMRLYTFFRSSASFRVRIALNHKGLTYEQVGVSLPKGEHLETGYKSVNAQGLVPALEDGGRLLTQSLAIIEYLDDVHPGPKLLPVASLDRAYAML